MNELGSLIPSRRREKTKEPDFGTYHHSTSVASKKVRAVVKAMFTDAFASIPFGRDDELRILDVGCWQIKPKNGIEQYALLVMSRSGQA